MIRLNNIKIKENLSNEEVLKFAIKKFHINPIDVLEWHISRKSIDARKKDDICFNYSIDLKVQNEHKYKQFAKVVQFEMPKINIKNNFSSNPVIVGAGPGGLFAAITLVQSGIKPIIVEQGDTVENRLKDVEDFQKSGKLNRFSNVQFGEGGAGTFSDGKLTTGIHSPYCQKVLQDFAYFGAPEEILYLAKPHIGTDNLIEILKNMRKYIISNGGQFLFNTKVTDFVIENNHIKSVKIENVITNKISELETNHLILAIGHSSRDTFKKLYECGFAIEKKNFSVGVRIEHLQQWINEAQYGTNPTLKLPPAEYKLAYHSKSGRSCYTFCMCPGGYVIASSSEAGTIVTNGMSKFARDGVNANSAVLVNIVPEDFSSDSPLAGMYFQQDLEEKAFALGGSNYYAPIQRLGDFMKNVTSEKVGIVKPTYAPGVTLANLNEILPQFISETLKEGISYFGKKVKNFSNPDSILTGLETRSSSPIRIVRNEKLVSNICGVYPCGEGAGYAGGIMSAAVDGIKCAIALLED